ncbi:hypothetical protein [Nonomuraea sp. NPDC049480]|uniref:hypothetical protein n=1 Tax=Nonomuraea sp. NPDC049480 TaxID=3364353 RepID=UPI00378D62C0
MTSDNTENTPSQPEETPADEVESLVEELELHSAGLDLIDNPADSSTCTCQTCSCTEV